MAQQPYGNRHPRQDQPHKVVSDGVKAAVARLDLSSDPIPAALFDTLAEEVAKELANAGQDWNKPAQIRRFYDELVGWQQRIRGNEAEFKKYEAFIRMMNAKVAYAKGRKLVDANFEEWFKKCVGATTSARALDHFRLHFEAVLGFLKGMKD